MFSQRLVFGDAMNKEGKKPAIEALEQLQALFVPDHPNISTLFGNLARAVQVSDEAFLTSLDLAIGQDTTTRKSWRGNKIFPMELCGICKCPHPRRPHGMCYGAG
jgi:hypothetical protein